MERKAVVGEYVIYTDPLGVDRPALVTAVWSAQCLNLVFVSSNAGKTDGFGRQTEHESSCMHVSSPGRAHGLFWRFAGETL